MPAGWICVGLTLAGAIATWRGPFWGLLGLIALLPFDSPLPWGVIVIYTNEAYLAGMALAFFVDLARRPAKLPAYFKFSWPFLIFLGAVALSIFPAVEKWATVRQFLRWNEFFLVLLIARFGLENRKQFNTLLQVLFGLGIVASAVGLYQHFMGAQLAGNAAMAASDLDRMAQGDNVFRAYSTFGHANQFAGFLILLLPLTFESFLENNNLRWQFVMGLVTLILALALAMTYSRGGWLSALLAIGIVMAYYIPRNLVKSMALFAVFLLMLLVLPLSLPNLNSRFTSMMETKKDTAVSGRFTYQKIALEIIAAKPVLGHGAGNYLQAITPYFKLYPGEIKYLDKHIHNMYSQIAIETGLLGLSAFLFFIGITIVRFLRNFRGIPDPKDRAMVVALLASMFAYLLHNNFDVLIIYARGIHFALILGLGLAFKMLVQEDFHGAEIQSR